MIANVLKSDIDAYVAGLRADSSLLAQARLGRVSPQAVSTYLNCVHYLIKYTHVCLRRGSDRARALGQQALAEHFEHKLQEEIGHERWAESDLRVLEGDFSVTPQRVVPSVLQLVEYLLKTIDECPERYLAYMLFAEYVTVLMGPEWVAMLERHCGIPRNALSVIERHVELDREHVVAGLREIEELVVAPEAIDGLRETLAQSMRYFSSFTREISALSN